MAKQELLAAIRDRYHETGTTRPVPRDRRRSLVPEGPEPDPGRIQRGQRIPSPARHQAAGTVRRRRRTAAWGQEPAHLRRGGPRGGNPGLGSIRPDLRKASQGGVAPPGGVHGATGAAGSGSPDAPATAIRQRCHPGPAAQTRQGHRTQPAERTTESEPGSPHPGSALRRLGPPSAGLPGNRPGGPLRNQHGGVVHLQPVATDVCTGWTEAVPLLAREQSLVVAGLETIAKQLPFPVLGIDSDIDSDNVSVFINDTLT